MKTQFTTFTFLFCCTLLFGLLPASASHLSGVEISYKYLSQDNYEVSLKTYRDCAGILQCAACSQPGGQGTCNIAVELFGADHPQGITHNLPAQSCNKQSFGNNQLQWIRQESGYDVLQLCELAKSICNNCNTRTAGTFTPGIEVFSFKGTINLSTVPASCCWVGIGLTHCCRSAFNNSFNNPGSLNYFSEAIINRCVAGGNSSAIQTTTPFLLTNYNSSSQNLKQINLGVIDPDGDSIAFRLAPSLVAHQTPTPYAMPYSAMSPFLYLGFPNTSPPLLPPSGINIHPVTGDIQFTTSAAFVSSFVVEILEYRYLSGVPTLVGLTRKDHQLVSQLSNPNSPSILSFYNAQNTLLPRVKDTFELSPNTQICLKIAAPDGKESWDTTDIKLVFTNADTVANPISITRSYNPANRAVTGPKYDSIQFCWTTPAQGNSNRRPFLFSFEAKDRACPIKSSYTKTMAFYVGNGGGLSLSKINEPAAFSLFPNPSNGYFTIKSKYNEAFVSVKVFNIKGELVKDFGLTQAQFEAEFKLPNLANGVYQVQILQANGSAATVPLVVEP